MKYCKWHKVFLIYCTGHRRFASKIVQSNDPNKFVDISHFTADKIRNFCIVAHVDHGKSTLADRFLELTGVVTSTHQNQILDRLQVERERGITVKAQTCSMIYKGVQAQTIANFWLAFENNLPVIPVINKIDLKHVDIPQVETQMKNLFDFHSTDIIHISAKSGLNVPTVLDAIIERIPSPNVNESAPFRGIIYDNWFDKYRGTIACIVVKHGAVRRGDTINSFHSSRSYEVSEVGIMHPLMVPVQQLSAGQVGYLIANMKSAKETHAGDLLYSGDKVDGVGVGEDTNMKQFQIRTFKATKPTVYAGLYPLDASDYDSLKQSIEQLSLNDPSAVINSDSSNALGLGWRIGFLGLLHMEVFSSRLEQEYGADVILTSPNIEYRAIIKDNETIRKRRYEGKGEIRIMDASKFPSPSDVERFLEPMITLTLVIRNEHLGVVNSICTNARGQRQDMQSVDDKTISLVWRIPLSEVLVDFFERLKRITSQQLRLIRSVYLFSFQNDSGYASFDYELDGYDEVNLVKMSISINDVIVNEFSQVIPAPMAKERAKLIVSSLKKEIPRQQFEVTIRARVGDSSKTITQAYIAPIRRDFTQLLKGNFGGGGMERLQKKLAHQKKGKQRMKTIGRVQIPKQAFINVLRN
ncbi:unnamed protein product [Anisakis simplex]|uniref:Translation factor GUF1 homolog, mitochondrial (inferred by orthology to a C. elegans protein) n=1 Tax=Anisakis simplex TaxID=6269 RepID=A0A0M3K6C9_ANISI|nr:unnamed protein product [Anisakis simplex]